MRYTNPHARTTRPICGGARSAAREEVHGLGRDAAVFWRDALTIGKMMSDSVPENVFNTPFELYRGFNRGRGTGTAAQ